VNSFKAVIDYRFSEYLLDEQISKSAPVLTSFGPLSRHLSNSDVIDSYAFPVDCGLIL
jgi:hypothetical protein